MKNDIEMILARLAEDGVEFDVEQVRRRAEEYLRLIREWNAYASLVSLGDAESELESHLADSWTLVPWIVSHLDLGQIRYVDLGSGDGFPAIPMCMILDTLETTLIERNEKKAIFLKKAVRRLELGCVGIENRSFDGELDGGPLLITSRAIEKPGEVIPQILAGLGIGDVYLCQSPALGDMDTGDGFQVERISDYYSENGYRRSILYVVRSK